MLLAKQGCHYCCFRITRNDDNLVDDLVYFYLTSGCKQILVLLIILPIMNVTIYFYLELLL